MCKIMILAGITAETQNAAKRFMSAAIPSMTKHDQDGVGYAASAIGTGELLGERWLNYRSAFKQRTPLNGKDREAVDRFGLSVDVEETYNSFGDLSAPFSSAMLHTRMATCGVNLTNVHPFVADDTALIHNGIISNPTEFKRTSTCDSEAILTSYLESGVDQVIDSTQDMADSLEGYYACGVLARDRDGARILDVFKSDTASLYTAWIKSLNSWIYCTRPEIIRDACKRARTRCSTPHAVKSGWLIRIDAETGNIRGTHRFSPRERAPITIGTYAPSRAWMDAADDKDDDKDVPALTLARR